MLIVAFEAKLQYLGGWDFGPLYSDQGSPSRRLPVTTGGARRPNCRRVTFPRMSPRRARVTGQSRQQIAQRLRDRRVREETLLVEATEALARRDAAETALSEAIDALTGALEELQRHGFDLAEIANLLEVTPTELTTPATPRRPSGRAVRPDRTGEASP